MQSIPEGAHREGGDGTLWRDCGGVQPIDVGTTYRQEIARRI